MDLLYNFYYKRIISLLLLYVVVVVLVKPLEVKIIEPPSSMMADRRYAVSCESTGSRPNAIITWYKGKRQLRRTKVNSVTRITNTYTHTQTPESLLYPCVVYMVKNSKHRLKTEVGP